MAFQTEINVALQRGHFRDAAELQQVVLYVLDNLNVGESFNTSPQRANIVQEICFRLDSMAPRYELSVPQVAVRLRILANNLRADTRDRRSDGT